MLLILILKKNILHVCENHNYYVVDVSKYNNENKLKICNKCQIK